MSNLISKAVSDLKFRIPTEILKEAFKEETSSWRSVPVDIEEQIKVKVIRPRVLIDCDLVGGVETQISLEGLTPSISDQTTTIYHIPKERTQNRSIMSVLSVGYINYGLAYGNAAMGYINPKGVNDILVAGMSVMNSHSAQPMVSTANVALIGENTVMIKDVNRIITNNYLRCILGNDENLNHISFRAIPKFCKLVELAVKSYIYNVMTVRMGEAFLKGGQELGVIKSIIEGYADSEQMYQDYLEQVISKVMFFSDPTSYSRNIRLLVGSTK